MKQQVIDKLMQVGYTKEQSEEYYEFYNSRNCVQRLEAFADDIIDMMEHDGGNYDEQSLLL